MAFEERKAQLERLVRECIEAYGPSNAVSMAKRWPDFAGRKGFTVTIDKASASELADATLSEKITFMVEELRQRPQRHPEFQAIASLELRNKALYLAWSSTISPPVEEAINNALYGELHQLLNKETASLGYVASGLYQEVQSL